MKKISSVHLTQALLYIHLLIIVAAIATGFFLPLWLVIFLVILHRIHIHLFQGCIVSHMQRFLGGLPREHDFLKECFYTYTNKMLSNQQEKWLDYYLASSPILIGVLHIYLPTISVVVLYCAITSLVLSGLHAAGESK